MKEKIIVNEGHPEKPLVADRGFKVFIGIDIQKVPWNISIYTAHGHYSTFDLSPIPQLLKKYIDDTFGNASVVCAYCASPYSSWIHRLLTSYNYQCLVADPQSVPVFNKFGDGNKMLDSRTIGNALRNGLIESIFPESKALLNRN